MAVEDLRELAELIPDHRIRNLNEAQTNQYLVDRFIGALGYNVSDFDQVIREYKTDEGSDEKVDYAIMANKVPVIVIESKAISVSLSDRRVSQLYKYFTPTEARIGILTNGAQYKFFSDIEKRNVMDRDPFWEFDLEDYDGDDLEQLGRLFSRGFDLAATLDSASRLKDVSMITGVLIDQFNDPDEKLARVLVNLAYNNQRKVTPSNTERFRQLTKNALDDFIRIMMSSDRRSENIEALGEPQPKIVTTAQEIEGHHIVKSIVRTVVDSNRVERRDRASHCSILLDNNQRRPLCLLRFNDEQKKQIVLFDEHRNQEIHEINSLDDIYSHADQLRETARRYLED